MRVWINCPHCDNEIGIEATVDFEITHKEAMRTKDHA